MRRWRLEPLDPGPALPLPSGRSLVAGRGSGCDLRLNDATVSRQHAELLADDDGVTLRDLGSANGTSVNGAPTTSARLQEHDILAFGRLEFRLAAGRPTPPAPRKTDAPEEPPAGTRVRSVDVNSGGGALARLQGERLAHLVEVAGALSGEIETDRLLAMIVDRAALLLPADRVALLLAEGNGPVLRPALSRNRLGSAAVEVPRSIVRRTVEERRPVLTENAVDDPRLRSGSVVAQQVRAALCVPLLTDAGQLLGVLYLDSASRSNAFSEPEAALAQAFAGLAAMSLAKAHFAERARREELARGNLERFFAPGVAARIAALGAPAPGGERREVTLLFSDVRGFIALAESAAPETMAAQLSEYFAAMADIVFAFGGTLDKFIGDALLAVWGAPERGQDDADLALAAARAMQAEVELLNAGWRAAGRTPFGVGIGLHHGPAFAGLIGSSRRLEYTVIGDVVNVAARLCDAAGAGEVVVSEAVKLRLRRPVPLRPADPLQVRGRELPVNIFRVEEGP